MSGLPYNELQDVDITATDKDGVTHVLATEHYAFVIPCRDCKHYREKDATCHSWQWHNWDEPADVEPDGFCAWACRKEQ